MIHSQHVDKIDSTSGEMKLEGFLSLGGAHSKVSFLHAMDARHVTDHSPHDYRHISSFVSNF